MTRLGKKELPQLVKDYERNVRASMLRKKYRLSNRGVFQALVEAKRQKILGKKSFDRTLLKRISFPFPQETEARFKSALSCLNIEVKHAILLELEFHPRTYVEIAKRLAEDTNTTLPSSETFASYLADSLVPSGLVIEERLGRGFGLVRRHYALSRTGQNYGQPLAAFSLKFAVDHHISLYQILGQSQSRKGSSSPYNRMRIVELVSKGCARMVDLMNALGLEIEDVRQHLDKLEALGILTYKSLDFGRGVTNLYSWVPGRSPEDASTVCELKSLTQKVAEWLYNQKRGERIRIARAIGYEHVTGISRVLGGLVKQGLAQTNFTAFDKSRISLLPGARVVLDYSQSVREALNGGPELLRMKNLLEDLRSNRNQLCKYFDAGVELHRGASPAINAKTRQEREVELLEFIKKYQSTHGTGLRPVDIVNCLGWSHGIATVYLRSLIGKKLLSRKKKGSATTYVAL